MTLPSRNRFRDARIESARVADVNVRDYTVSVYTEESWKKFFDIPFSSPYLHFSSGSGIHFLPEAGATCWICFPSDFGPPFVLGWYGPPDGEGSMRGFRRAMEPGDLVMDGRDGNYVWVRRGGIVEVAATPICRRFYIPIDNIIRDVAGSYRLQTLGGAWDWSVSREEDDPDGRQPVRFAVGIREFADDEKVLVSLDVAGAVGKDEDDADIAQALLSDGGVIKSDSDLGDRPALQFRIFNPADDFATVINYKMSKDGSVSVDYKGGASLTIKETLAVLVEQGDLTMETADGSMTLKCAKDVLLEAKNGQTKLDLKALLISTLSGVKVTGGSVKVETDVTVGGPTDTVNEVLLRPFMDWVFTHTHQDGPPPASVPAKGPPNPALPPLLAQFFSAVLKAKPAL